jgi:hypothetical protein
LHGTECPLRSGGAAPSPGGPGRTAPCDHHRWLALGPRAPSTLGTGHGVPYATVRYVARKACASSVSMVNATIASPDAYDMTLA